MNEVADEVPLDVRVRWEIWESFVSLLRSYAAVAAGSQNTYTVHSFSDWAKVEHHGRAVRFCFAPTTGDGVWRVVHPDCELWGEFHINEDGTFQFPEGPKALDIAVIDWIQQLGQDNLLEDRRTLPHHGNSGEHHP